MKFQLNKGLYSLALCAAMLAGSCETAWADIPNILPFPTEGVSTQASQAPEAAAVASSSQSGSAASAASQKPKATPPGPLPENGAAASANLPGTGVSAKLPETGDIASADLPKTGDIASADLPGTGDIASADLPETQTAASAEGEAGSKRNPLAAGPGAMPVSTVTEPITGYLNGSRLTMLANQSHCQMLSLLLETNSGSVVMVDGGTPEDAAYLTQQLAEKGGHVDTWLITHPHFDHAGALIEILNHPEWNIAIDNIYYSFLPAAWYEENEAHRADVMARLFDAFSRLPESMLHGDIYKGQKLQVDNVRITVLNQPYQFSGNSINNSSVAYMLDINGKRALVLGDMGPEAAGQLLADYSPEALKCDIVQMSHHGQYGADFNFYKAVRPEICLWPTPQWLWDNEGSGGVNTGIYRTVETRLWMASLGVPYHLSIKDGDQVIR